MSGWNDVTLGELLAEIDVYANEDGFTTEEGWFTLEEMTERYGVNRHRMSRIVAKLEARGRIEKAKRAARRIDGVRHWPVVYRLVKPHDTTG